MTIEQAIEALKSGCRIAAPGVVRQFVVSIQSDGSQRVHGRCVSNRLTDSCWPEMNETVYRASTGEEFVVVGCDFSNQMLGVVAPENLAALRPQIAGHWSEFVREKPAPLSVVGGPS